MESIIDLNDLGIENNQINHIDLHENTTVIYSFYEAIQHGIQYFQVLYECNIQLFI